MYIYATNEHIYLVERHLQTLKQQFRAIRHGLPYVLLPILMVVHLVIFVYFSFNAFPPKIGISHKVAPEEFIGGRALDFNKHCRFGFESYAQTCE